MSAFYITTAIEYANGEPHLGHTFEKIGADAALSNTASDKILRYFGFTEVAQENNQRYYILHKKDWIYIL